MFCKLLMNDYNWRFSKGENIQLSEYHKIWEIGHLRYQPFGGKEKNSQYSAHYAIVNTYIEKGYNFSDWYKWIDSLTSKKTNISFIDEISKIEHSWLSSEFWNLLLELTKIIINKNNIITIVEDSFEKYNLQGFSYFPESMLIKPLQFILNKTTNVYDVKLNQNKNNTATITLKRSIQYNKEKLDIYLASASKIGDYVVISAYPLIIKKLFRLSEKPVVNYIEYQNDDSLKFEIEWHKRLLTIPYLNIMAILMFDIVISFINIYYSFTNIPTIIVISLLLIVIAYITRKIQIEKTRRIYSEENVIKLIEDSNNRLEQIEKVSEELIEEKQSLEQKVEDRTRELAQANEKLQELDHLKSNFFANISHEIRTPLTLILSPIESVLQGDYGKKIDRKFFENLQRNAIRLLKLINNLLDFSKIEAGRMGMKVQESDIVRFIKTYVGSVHSAAESKGISLNFVSINDEVPLYFDKEKMDKIIMNLFSNALKFTDKGGSIKIVVKDTEKDCIIEFTDTGVGVPSEKLESIFDRFSQADSSSTRKFEGTGIGLALAKELVELHGGTITVKSRHIDEHPNDHGTTFTVTIPRGKDHLSSNENVEYLESEDLDESVTDHRFAGMREMTELRAGNQSSPLLPAGEGGQGGEVSRKEHLITLLVVEDNPDMRNFLTFLLQDSYTVHTAENGEEGLRKARELRPDLIVSDVMMPVMNGYEMTQKIKEDEELKRTPVLMLTAKAEIANKIEGLEYGADDYLTKPFNSKELLTRIKSLLKINMLQRELLDLNQNLEEKVKEQLDTIMKGDELKRYLPPQLVDSIVKGEKHVTFENERRKLTIFFSDIKGFTETTDSMEAEELSLLLNEYLTEMTKIAHRYGGTIDKFIGDAIMIFFGAPESTTEKDQAHRCVKMAIEMQEKMKELKQKWFKSGIEYPLEIRIGINTGTATVGNFGAEDRLSYTAIGGQVNLASRLEGLCNPGGILISHSTWAHVEDEVPCKVRGKVKVKGINREILVYDVEIDRAN